MRQQLEASLSRLAVATAALALTACTTVRAPADTSGPLDRPAMDVGLLQARAPDAL